MHLISVVYPIYTLFIELCAVTSVHNAVVAFNYHAQPFRVDMFIHAIKVEFRLVACKNTAFITDLHAAVTAQS